MRDTGTSGSPEPHVVKTIQRYLYGLGAAIGVGAYVGYHALPMAPLAPADKVYLFEGQILAHEQIH